MANACEKVLDEIKSRHISPIPKWIFVMKKSFLWVLFSLSLVSGGLATAVIIFVARNNDWDIYQKAYNGFAQFMLLTMPYFWIITLFVIVLVTIFEMRCLPGAYRYASYLTIIASIGASCALGSVFYRAGLGQYMGELFDTNVPFYHVLDIHGPNQAIWVQPDQGLLAGEIVAIDPENDALDLNDFSGNQWHVFFGQAVVHSNTALKERGKVKIIGEVITPNSFNARDIRPWVLGGCRCPQCKCERKQLQPAYQ